MEKLLKSEDCPTGIYCANDITAVGILKYLRKCRNLYFTPSIIASDDIEEAQFYQTNADDSWSSKRRNGTICPVSASGQNERRPFGSSPNGTIRETAGKKQLLSCFGELLE